MTPSDSENLELVETPTSVDSINAEFYGRFPYPWTPMTFSYLADDAFEAAMLNQDVGDYSHQTAPARPDVWVAGCGTNQAVYTALRFPRSTVLGSDLSASSLELCGSTARDLGLRHLELERKSLNDVTYENLFDYVICTGVIHHNAEPRAVLAKLSAALKPGGILELMVYNRYHRSATTAFQKVLRALNGTDAGVDFEADLVTAKQVIRSIPEISPMASWLSAFTDTPEAALADSLMQPVEYSYTVQSLHELAASCGLELVLPCINQYDKAEGRISWNMKFGNGDLQTRYDSLADLQRWQITNLLMMSKSPLLWFYMRRQDDSRRTTERQACDSFLQTTFSRARTMRHTYRRTGERQYKLSPRAVPYPPAPEEERIAKVVAMADGKTSMADIFARLGIEADFHNTNEIRLRSATTAFPYLRAVA